MHKEGLPIEGFCVATGIPTTEKAVEIIDGLKTAGIRHVAFKPLFVNATLTLRTVTIGTMSDGDIRLGP